MRTRLVRSAWYVRAALAVSMTAIMAAGAMLSATAASGAPMEWSQMSTPFLLPGSNELLSLSCPSGTVNFCMAVGGLGTPASTSSFSLGGYAFTPTGALAEAWNGKWRVTKVPSPGQNAAFYAVSCSSSSYCLALGTDGNANPNFAEVWNGSAWSIVASPPGSAFDNFYRSVSCWSTDCLLVGTTVNARVAELWDGQSWTTVSQNLPGQLFGVSCVATGQCLVDGVGSPTITGPFGPSVGALFNAGVWTEEPPPHPQASYSGVSCATTPLPVSCLAVGSGSGGEAAVADAWNSATGTWATTAPVTPTPPNNTQLSGWSLNQVSCPAANLCVAAGDLSAASPRAAHPEDYRLMEMWNGSTWTQMKLSSSLNSLDSPNQPLSVASADPPSVSCPTPTFCITLGYRTYTAGYQYTTPVIASWGTAP